MKLRDKMMPGLPCSTPTITSMINLQVQMVWPLLHHATTRLVTVNFVCIGKLLKFYYVYPAILWIFIISFYFRLVTRASTYPLKLYTTVSKNNLGLTKLRLFLRLKVNMTWAELWPKTFWTDLG